MTLSPWFDPTPVIAEHVPEENLRPILRTKALLKYQQSEGFRRDMHAEDRLERLRMHVLNWRHEAQAPRSTHRRQQQTRTAYWFA